MKSFIRSMSLLFSALASLVISVRADAGPVPQHWVRGGVVYYVVAPVTDFTILVFKESEAQWAVLQLDVEYPESTRDQLLELEALYPGRRLERVLARGIDEPRIEIGVFGLRVDGRWVSRPLGPAVTQSILLTQRQTEALMSASDSQVRVLGRMHVSLPSLQSLEAVSLPPETCDRLLSSKSTVRSVLVQYATISAEIDRMRTRYPETKTRLKESVLQSCIELDGVDPVGSFAEVLELRVTVKQPRTAPRGETLREGRTEEAADFRAEFPARPRSL